MAIVKISELPIATSAAPTDVFALVGGGVTYQINTTNFAQSLAIFPYTGSATISGSFSSIGPAEITNLATSNTTLLNIKSQNTDKFSVTLDASGYPRLGINTAPAVALDVSGSGALTGDLNVTRDVTSRNLSVQQSLTASAAFITGSTRFGSSTSNDTHQFTGSFNISGSSTTITGSLRAQSITGSLRGNVVGNITGTVTGDITGNAATVTNGVYTVGDQTIAGIKTFSSTIAGSISGNAATATALQTARNINGVSFNGTANISINTNNAVTFNNAGAGAASGTTFDGSAARTISYNTIGAPSTGGTNATGTWSIAISGNANTATTWATSRTLTIGSTGKSVNGSGDVSWTLGEIGAAAIAQTMYIGTTAVTINRGFGALSLTGVSIDGNAGSVTNGVYTNGSYSDPSWITSLAGSKISGNISGNSSNITSYTIDQSVGTESYPSFNDIYFYSHVARDNNPYFFDPYGQSAITNAGAYTMIVYNTAAINSYANFKIDRTQNGAITEHYRAGTFVGSISITASATAYNTSSDYRLKKNIISLTGGLEKLMKIKARKFNWIETEEEGIGFIAHELAEVAPEAVTGEKDAVDAEGKPKYQAVDPAKLVATLVAAVQEQQAQIDKLKLEIELLKNQ